MLFRVHSTYARTLHACAVVELRFVTERKKNKNKNKNGAEFIPRAFPSESPNKKCVHYKITFDVENTFNSIPFRCYK